MYCQKLARADAEVCSRCGHAFDRTRIMRSAVRRSIPPASPHHAGHYSGLHPEDQPYQSTMMSIVRSDESSQPQQAPHEPDGIILPTIDEPSVFPTSPVSPAALPTASAYWQEARLSPAAPIAPLPPGPRTPVPPPARNTPIPDLYNDERDMTEREARVGGARPQALDNARLRFPVPPSPPSVPPYMPSRSPLRSRPILTVLTISFLLLLLATGLLAYMFISKKPQASFATATLSAVPSKLRVNDQFLLSGKGFGANDLMSFTYDKNEPILDGNGKLLYAHTDALGAFYVTITVGNWGFGDHIIHAIDEAQQFSDSVTITIETPPPTPPSLQLTQTHLDLGAAARGTVSSMNVTLTNAGGGQLRWQASSDQPWLSIAPSSGTFNGSKVVVVTVNRGTLAPLAYTGHISFTQQGSHPQQPLKLTVTMAVNAAPATLTISPVSLSYSGSTAQNPASQTITMQNGGGQPLNWSETTITGNGVPWLSVTPASGQLPPGASATVTVSVQSQLLAVGSYQGVIAFKGGSNPQVSVSLNVTAPGSLVVSPPSLNFSAYTGHNPASQSVTLQNSGGQALNWAAVAAVTNGANWLSVSPPGGQLGPGGKATITIAVNGVGLQANAYQGTVTFNSNGQSRQVAIALTISTPPAPAINVQVHTLNFSSIMGKDPTAQTFIISNTGNATLNWSASEDQIAATYAPIAPTSGSLAPAQSATVTVSPTTAQLGAGSLSGTITIADSDTGVSIPPQKVVVNITVLDQPQISVSTNELDFSNDSTLTDSSQLLVITNTGSSDLNWAVTLPSQSADWLSVDNSGGTLPPGQSVVIDVTCDSSQLATGSYTAALQVSDSDPGTPVTPQTVTVVLTVS
ncbi:MAG TPA: choice-of-anchor D domain-containing protein [Ktedonobacteraceae bacterium]|nr:choice-of-anchor D domain-containing protein [Ktedonobacteraceae bacterium]